jgi:hypothetical protein
LLRPACNVRLTQPPPRVVMMNTLVFVTQVTAEWVVPIVMPVAGEHTSQSRGLLYVQVAQPVHIHHLSLPLAKKHANHVLQTRTLLEVVMTGVTVFAVQDFTSPMRLGDK